MLTAVYTPVCYLWLPTVCDDRKPPDVTMKSGHLQAKRDLGDIVEPLYFTAGEAGAQKVKQLIRGGGDEGWKAQLSLQPTSFEPA